MNIVKNNLRKYIYFTILSILAACGNMGVVYLINRIINDYFSGTAIVSLRYLLYFCGSLVLFFTSRWVVSIGIIGFTQQLLMKTRIDVLKMVLRSQFRPLVNNKDKIFSALTRDVDNIVNASINLVDVLTNGVVVLICFVYMGVLSWKLLCCMLVLMVFTLAIYIVSSKRAQQLFEIALGHNDRFVRYLNEILSGFKEVTLERSKGHEIADKHMYTAVEKASGLSRKALVNFLNNRIVGQIAFYVFIGLVMLFLGDLFQVNKGVLVNFIFLILYVWGPIETVVLLVPNMSQASASIRRLGKLELEMIDPATQEENTLPLHAFSKLDMQDIQYTYQPDETEAVDRAFSIGPVDFMLEAGETVFISGGNGSGKTTFINVLTGLFRYDEGTTLVNDTPVGNTQSRYYQSMFAPVFNDFHLFDECYGMENVDAEKAQEYLRLFEIDQKVTFDGGKFSTIQLSAGQRKRLALICAMLERKPILILDEFAADQDPEFKKKFYTQILSFIKAEGFTLLAITHDDHYYRCADRLYHMDSGRLHPVAQTAASPVA